MVHCVISNAEQTGLSTAKYKIIKVYCSKHFHISFVMPAVNNTRLMFLFKTVLCVYHSSPLSPQSVFHELATIQYGVPSSTPHPSIFTAWPPSTSPVTCWYTPTTTTVSANHTF